MNGHPLLLGRDRTRLIDRLTLPSFWRLVQILNVFQNRQILFEFLGTKPKKNRQKPVNAPIQRIFFNSDKFLN